MRAAFIRRPCRNHRMTPASQPRQPGPLAIIDDAIVYSSRKAAVPGSSVNRLELQGEFTTELRDILRQRIERVRSQFIG